MPSPDDQSPLNPMTSQPLGTAPRMAVREPRGGTVVVALQGELTREGHLDHFRATIADRWDDDAVREIRVDLSETTAIDLQGLGALLALRRECGLHGAAFVVDNPRGSVRSRLEQTGTLDYLRGPRRTRASGLG